MDDEPDEPDDSVNKLSLSEDFYCMTYCSFLKENKFRKNKRASYFMQCFFIFLLQGLLSFFIFKELGANETADGDTTTSNLIIMATDTNMLTVRFLCSILLHIQLEGETRRALSMIKYFNNHHEQFIKGSYGPFFVALMQLIGCLAAEALNVLLVCR